MSSSVERLPSNLLEGTKKKSSHLKSKLTFQKDNNNRGGMQDIPFIANVLDSENRQLKEKPGAQTRFWILQHCSPALLQQGGVTQLHNLIEHGATGDR